MKKTAQLARTLFYQEMLINISKHQFQSSINHQEYLFHRRFITNYFCPVNIAKFLSKVFKTFACYFLTNFYFSPNDSPSKTMKDVSYFILKSLFVLRYSIFGISIFLFFIPVTYCFTAWSKINIKVDDVMNCLNKDLKKKHFVYFEIWKKLWHWNFVHW